MPFITPLRTPPREPIPIDARAADHLRYIRETMERAAEFTAVPGWGGVAMGFTAIGAAWIASRQASPRAWLTVWLVEAFVAVAIAASSAATKAHRGEREIAFRAGPQISIELYSSDHRRRPAHFCAVSSRRADGTPRHLVAAVRYGDCHRRGLFRARHSGYGAGHHGFGSDRAFRAV